PTQPDPDLLVVDRVSGRLPRLHLARLELFWGRFARRVRSKGPRRVSEAPGHEPWSGEAAAGVWLGGEQDSWSLVTSVGTRERKSSRPAQMRRRCHPRATNGPSAGLGSRETLSRSVGRTRASWRSAGSCHSSQSNRDAAAVRWQGTPPTRTPADGRCRAE